MTPHQGPVGRRIALTFSVPLVTGTQPHALTGSLETELTVKGKVLESGRDPRVRLELRSFVEYAGAKCWVLYSESGCESDGLA